MLCLAAAGGINEYSTLCTVVLKLVFRCGWNGFVEQQIYVGAVLALCRRNGFTFCAPKMKKKKEKKGKL